MEETKKSEAPALPQQVEGEVDWPDAVPVKIPPQSDQDNDYNISVVSSQSKTNYSEIPELESESNEEEEGQFEDIQNYLDHHNTYQESQNIHKESTKRLLDLDDERYYRDIDCMYKNYSQDRAHIPAIQSPASYRTMQELILQTAFYWFLPCLDLLPVALLFAYVFPGFLVPRCALLFGEYL